MAKPKINGGKESARHRRRKEVISASLRQAGFPLVLCEHRCGDVVACRRVNGSLEILVFEIEHSPRHVLANLKRDFSQGCDRVVIVCPDEGLAQRIQRLLEYRLPQDLRARVTVTTEAELDLSALIRLESNPQP